LEWTRFPVKGLRAFASVLENAPTVCTFFEEFDKNPKTAADYVELLEIWRQSWAIHGWRTLILTQEDAEKHPRYPEWKAAFEMLPTINPKKYEMSCYVRWVAMVQAGCGVYQF
jgi:hypothetical protein